MGQCQCLQKTYGTTAVSANTYNYDGGGKDTWLWLKLNNGEIIGGALMYTSTAVLQVSVRSEVEII